MVLVSNNCINQDYTVTIGGGGGAGRGAPNGTRGGSGGNSIFSTITSTGGGRGGIGGGTWRIWWWIRRFKVVGVLGVQETLEDIHHQKEIQADMVVSILKVAAAAAGGSWHRCC